MLSEEDLAELLSGGQGIAPLDAAREILALRQQMADAAAVIEQQRQTSEMLAGVLSVREHELSEAAAARDAARARVVQLAEALLALAEAARGE